MRRIVRTAPVAALLFSANLHKGAGLEASTGNTCSTNQRTGRRHAKPSGNEYTVEGGAVTPTHRYTLTH